MPEVLAHERCKELTSHGTVDNAQLSRPGLDRDLTNVQPAELTSVEDTLHVDTVSGNADAGAKAERIPDGHHDGCDANHRYDAGDPGPHDDCSDTRN
jgi:hypothetical protein